MPLFYITHIKILFKQNAVSSLRDILNSYLSIKSRRINSLRFSCMHKFVMILRNDEVITLMLQKIREFAVQASAIFRLTTPSYTMFLMALVATCVKRACAVRL